MVNFCEAGPNLAVALLEAKATDFALWMRDRFQLCLHKPLRTLAANMDEQ